MSKGRPLISNSEHGIKTVNRDRIEEHAARDSLERQPQLQTGFNLASTAMVAPTREHLQSLKRSELQKLCKASRRIHSPSPANPCFRNMESKQT